MRRLHPFLHAFCTQEGALLLYIFFQNHNCQGGTGNFTYKASILAGEQKALYHQNYLPRKQLYILLKPPSHSLQLQLVTQLASQLYCTTRITSLAIKSHPFKLLFLPIMLCCNALKIHLLCQNKNFCQTIMLLCMVIHYMQQTILYRLFYLSVLIKSTSILYHTMTVLLAYINRSLQFSINA